MNLLLVKKMVIKSNKKNPMAKELFTKKYKPIIVKSKKGKGSFKRKKK
jgi:stalled ribosome alternative rescue factor ArfA